MNQYEQYEFDCYIRAQTEVREDFINLPTMDPYDSGAESDSESEDSIHSPRPLTPSSSFNALFAYGESGPGSADYVLGLQTSPSPGITAPTPSFTLGSPWTTTDFLELKEASTPSECSTFSSTPFDNQQGPGITAPTPSFEIAPPYITGCYGSDLIQQPDSWASIDKFIETFKYEDTEFGISSPFDNQKVETPEVNVNWQLDGGHVDSPAVDGNNGTPYVTRDDMMQAPIGVQTPGVYEDLESNGPLSTFDNQQVGTSEVDWQHIDGNNGGSTLSPFHNFLQVGTPGPSRNWQHPSEVDGNDACRLTPTPHTWDGTVIQTPIYEAGAFSPLNNQLVGTPEVNWQQPHVGGPSEFESTNGQFTNLQYDQPMQHSQYTEVLGSDDSTWQHVGSSNAVGIQTEQMNQSDVGCQVNPSLLTEEVLPLNGGRTMYNTRDHDHGPCSHIVEAMKRLLDCRCGRRCCIN